jgi:DNA-binding response OmpR family regulator
MREHDIPVPAHWAELPRRVLIVEDNPVMSSLIELVLKHEGFEVAIARDGFAAGTLLQSFKPGLMTLDLRMPQMDGMAVLRFLQENPGLFSGKVLIISGEEQERIREALALGADGALQKPFRNAELVATVVRLLGAPKPASFQQEAAADRLAVQDETGE